MRMFMLTCCDFVLCCSRAPANWPRLPSSLSGKGVRNRELLQRTRCGLPEAMSAQLPEAMTLSVADSQEVKLPDGSSCRRHVLLNQVGSALRYEGGPATAPKQMLSWLSHGACT